MGCVRAKNAKNTVIMTLLDAAFASIGWWITGFAFAFGDPLSAGPMRVVVGPGNGFIGYQYFVLSGYPGDMWQYWLFQYAVCVVCLFFGWGKCFGRGCIVCFVGGSVWCVVIVERV